MKENTQVEPVIQTKDNPTPPQVVQPQKSNYSPIMVVVIVIAAVLVLCMCCFISMFGFGFLQARTFQRTIDAQIQNQLEDRWDITPTPTNS